MTAANDKVNDRGLFSFLRRGQQWLKISGYHVGDIQSDKPVAVGIGATLVGNVFAPQVSVAGLLCGSTIARETSILAEGQVWGDVYTISLRLEPGGKIQGWVNSLNEADYHSLQAAGELPEDDLLPGQFEALADLPEGSLPVRSRVEIDAMRRLQTEAGVAMAARTELEQAFEKRLSEVAGEASAKVVTLREELEDIRSKVDTAQQQAEEAEENLRLREAQIERQTGELSLVHKLLDERNQEVEALRQAHDQRGLEFDQLQMAKATVDALLEETQRQVEVLTDRVHSLETALQASLQHSAEQEESLLRWQELAEVTEARALKLEKELESARRQSQEGSRTIELLKEQRRKAEDEWSKTSVQLAEKIDRLETVSQERQQLQEALAKATAELDVVRSKATRPLAAVRASSADAEALDPMAQITRLEARLVEVEQGAQEQYDQLLWYKASMQTTRLELEQMRQLAGHYEGLLAQRQTDLAAKQALVEKWQKEVQTMATKMQKQDRRLKKAQADIELWQQQAATEKATMEQSLRQYRLQQEASEAEIDQHLEEMAVQGQRLAEIQATLIERELQLQQAQAAVAKQSQAIKQIKETATAHIRRLENQLGQMRPLAQKEASGK